MYWKFRLTQSRLAGSRSALCEVWTDEVSVIDQNSWFYRMPGRRRGQQQVGQAALSKLLKREGRAGVEGAILPYVGHLQLISTLKIGADCCQLCQYKLTKPNLT